MDIICLNNSFCLEPCLKRFNRKLHARLGYVIFDMVCLLIAAMFGGIAEEDEYFENLNGDRSNQKYHKSMYSVSFALAFFHFLIIILSLMGTKVTIPLNKGLWTGKFVLVFGVYLLAYCINSRKFYNGYLKFVKFVSLGLIIYMCLLCISFGHFLNVRLFGNVEACQEANIPSTKWQALLWILTVVFYISYIGFYCDVLFNCFSDEKNKVGSFLFALIGCIAMIVVSVVSVLPQMERKRLLTSAYVSSFVAYLHWSAFFINDKDVHQEERGVRDFLDVIIGLIYLLASLLYLSLSSKKMKQIKQEDKLMANNPFLEYDEEGAAMGEGLDTLTVTQENSDGQQLEVIKVTRSYFIFQGYLFFASVYYAVHMTGWDVYVEDYNKEDTRDGDIHRGYGYWIKIITTLVAILVYVWMLIAAKCCPDREFDF